eukprot:Gb_09346 [translate_table: standard]
MGFEKYYLDYVMVPAGLLVLSAYHAWLLYRVINFPSTTVLGINAINRRIWVETMMADSVKNGVLAVQTMRNNIMASTVLASTAITLCSLIGLLVSNTGSGYKGSAASQAAVFGDRSPLGSSVKYSTILVCFFIAFMCSVQSIRYYSHVNILINVPTGKHFPGHSVKYVTRAINRGGHFWSLGLRAFYFSFPLFLWTVGPIPMFFCCCILVLLLYFLDIADEETLPPSENHAELNEGLPV